MSAPLPSAKSRRHATGLRYKSVRFPPDALRGARAPLVRPKAHAVMTASNATATPPTWIAPPGRSTSLKYARDGELNRELRKRVAVYFDENKISRGGGTRMLLKTATIFAWVGASYVGLMFWATAWWHFALLSLSMGWALSGVGFCVQHDGGHGAYSDHKGTSRLAAMALDFIGGSSYMWHHKHNVLHHTYPNVEQVDDDISQSPWLRLNESDPWLGMHRYQHWYSWLLYGLIPFKWMLLDDFRRIFTQRAGPRHVPPPKGRVLATLLLGKVVAYSWVYVLPLVVHGPSWGMLAVYVFISWVFGVTLATVFQLAHCTVDAEFTPWPLEGQSIELPWAEQQLATTVNFSQHNPFLTWYLGGLNFQIEHHLFPKVCHVHYPAISSIVREVCEERGIAYRVQPSITGALAAHIEHLQRMGARPATVVADGTAGV